jgi:hypothetical protein
LEEAGMQSVFIVGLIFGFAFLAIIGLRRVLEELITRRYQAYPGVDNEKEELISHREDI